MPVHAATAERVVLDVEVGIAGGGHRAGDADSLVMGVDDHRQRELVGGLPDGVVHGVAVRDARAAGQECPTNSSRPPTRLISFAAAAGFWGEIAIRPRRRGSGSKGMLQHPVVVRARELGCDARVGHDAEATRDVVGSCDAERDMCDRGACHDLFEVDPVQAGVGLWGS